MAGTLTLAGAELAAVHVWRFSQQDRADAQGGFGFRTKIGPLEDQLLPGQPYGQTDWADPHIGSSHKSWFCGSAVSVAHVRFESSSGAFEFLSDAVSFFRCWMETAAWSGSRSKSAFRKLEARMIIRL